MQESIQFLLESSLPFSMQGKSPTMYDYHIQHHSLHFRLLLRLLHLRLHLPVHPTVLFACHDVGDNPIVDTSPVHFSLRNTLHTRCFYNIPDKHILDKHILTCSCICYTCDTIYGIYIILTVGISRIFGVTFCIRFSYLFGILAGLRISAGLRVLTPSFFEGGNVRDYGLVNFIFSDHHT